MITIDRKTLLNWDKLSSLEKTHELLFFSYMEGFCSKKEYEKLAYALLDKIKETLLTI